MNLTKTINLLFDLLSQVGRTYGRGYPVTGTSTGAREKAGARVKAMELELGNGKRI